VTSAGGFSEPEPLHARHVLEGFDCGSEQLNTWLARYALQSHAAGGSRTRVVCQRGRVIGFYSLAAGNVEPEDAPERVKKGQGQYSIPLVVLARLAVDRSAQGRGLGEELLRDALLKVAEVAEVVGVRTLLVHAKDDRAKHWYESVAEFEESPIDPRQLFLLIKDLRAMIARP
jgi:ribosomal protein S18 acetylase RimI-like enzyme